MNSSFSLITNSSKISNVLDSLTSTSTTNDVKLTLKTPTNSDSQSNPKIFDHPEILPPLVLEINNNNKDSSSFLFPAFAVMRSHKEQIMIPDECTMDPDEEEEGELLNNEHCCRTPTSVEDVLFKVIADDFSRCIVLAETSSQLMEFALKHTNIEKTDDNTSLSSSPESVFYFFPSTYNSNRTIRTKNILLSEKDKEILSISVFGKEKQQQQEDIRQKHQEIIRRVNSQIIDAAASVLNSGVSADRLAQIYDEVDSRKEKIMKTRSVGGRQNKDVKTVVVPMMKKETGEEGLMKIAFTSTTTTGAS
jgi:hypothetical protein